MAGESNVPKLSSQTQLRAYTLLRAIEARAQGVDALIDSLKRCSLQAGVGALPDLLNGASELRWLLQDQQQQVIDFESCLGKATAGAPAVPSHPQEPAGLRGTTSALSVCDIVGMLAALKKTGTLTLQQDVVMYVFEFQEGAVVHAITNEWNPDMRLGSILLAQGKLTDEQLQHNLDASTQSERLLGVQLVNSGVVSEGDLRVALQEQVHLIFDLAFELKNAQFTFVDGSISDIEQRVSMNTLQLMLECARLRDERKEEQSRVPLASDVRGVLDSILDR